jgi:hypothetical protein
MNLNHVLKKVGRGSCHDLFSDSTCSGVSKTSYGFLVHGRLGQQVPQHDVMYVCTSKKLFQFIYLVKLVFYRYITYL